MGQSFSSSISPSNEYSGLMLKLKPQYFGHLMWRANSLEKTLMLGKIWDRGWDGWMASLTQWMWIWANSGRWRTGKSGMSQSMGLQRVGYNLVIEEQQQWDWVQVLGAGETYLFLCLQATGFPPSLLHFLSHFYPQGGRNWNDTWGLGSGE